LIQVEDFLILDGRAVHVVLRAFVGVLALADIQHQNVSLFGRADRRHLLFCVCAIKRAGNRDLAGCEALIHRRQDAETCEQARRGHRERLAGNV
jgi:hypothetical protein